MDIKKLGLGLGAFAAGAAAWIWGASRYGDKVARALDLDPAIDEGAGTVSRGAATAPAGLAAADRQLAPSGTGTGGEHSAPDLAASDPVRADARAPEQFRPDPTAVPTAEEREALRPATGPAPSLVADRGSGFAEGAGAA